MTILLVCTWVSNIGRRLSPEGSIGARDFWQALFRRPGKPRPAWGFAALKACPADPFRGRLSGARAPNRTRSCAAKFFPLCLNLFPGSRDHSMQTTPDEALIGRIAGGDRLAMQVLYARHHVRVYRFLLRLVRNEATAEDLMSEVFLDVWRQASRFEGRSSVSTWVLAIARFKALSSFRRRTEGELTDEVAAAIEDPADDPAVELQKKDQSAVLRQCLEALSVEHREIIDLVYYHEKSVEEVAEIVGIPEGTVKTRMFYARKKLAELLKARGVERGYL